MAKLLIVAVVASTLLRIGTSSGFLERSSPAVSPRQPSGKEAKLARLVPDSLVEFRQANAMICACRAGRLKEAVNVCTQAGLIVIRTHKSRELVACGWPPGTLKQATFARLADSGEFRYIEPAISPTLPILPKEQFPSISVQPAPRHECARTTRTFPPNGV